MTKQVESAELESVCTYCRVGCDITGVVEDNKIVKIFAQKDRVVSEGKLCIKGKYGYDFVEAKDRVREPRIKKDFLTRNPQIVERFGEKLSEFERVYDL